MLGKGTDHYANSESEGAAATERERHIAFGGCDDRLGFCYHGCIEREAFNLRNLPISSLLRT